MKKLSVFIKEQASLNELFSGKSKLPVNHVWQEKRDVLSLPPSVYSSGGIPSPSQFRTIDQSIKDTYHVNLPDHLDPGVITIHRHSLQKKPGIAEVHFSMPPKGYGVPSDIKKTYDKAYQGSYKKLRNELPASETLHDKARQEARMAVAANHGIDDLSKWSRSYEVQRMSRSKEGAETHTIGMFSAVAKAMRHHVANNSDTKEFQFSASNDLDNTKSRKKLYTALAKRYNGRISRDPDGQPMYHIPVNTL